MKFDAVLLRLQQIGAGRVELFSPKVSAAASVDELMPEVRTPSARIVEKPGASRVESDSR